MISSLSVLSCCFWSTTYKWGIISLIFGSEVVKIEDVCLLVSQVSGETHSTATDTPGVCEGDERRGGKRRREETKKIRRNTRKEETCGPCLYEDRKEKLRDTWKGK